MTGKIKKIHLAFGGKLHGSKMMKKNVCEAVSRLPKPYIEHITSDCWFLGSTEDAWAFTFSGSDIAGKHLIIISDDLLNQPYEQIHYTILHEIGHVILKHRNAILKPQTQNHIKKQEKEADEFARKYLR